MDYIGSIKTVCKGIDKADDCYLTHESKIKIIPEPDNKFDPNALKVCVINPDSVSGGIMKAGYLPRKLAQHICTYFLTNNVKNTDNIGDEKDVKDNKESKDIKENKEENDVKIDCIVLGRIKNGLSELVPQWVDLRLDFYCKSENVRLKKKLEMIIESLNKDVNNRI